MVLEPNQEAKESEEKEDKQDQAEVIEWENLGYLKPH